MSFLRDPGNSALFYGFEALFKDADTSPAWYAAHVRLVYNELLRFCEALGTVKIENPEFYNPAGDPPAVVPADDLLNGIDAALGIRVKFPNPFKGEHGLATSRGIATLRTIDALYEAWRIRSLTSNNPSARVLEIGAGLGRVAFFASKLGIKNYTIIDIPMTSVAQSYFLGTVLGDEAVSLFGEEARGIRILPPSAFLDGTETYDLILNADSFPEMDLEISGRYAQAIARRSKQFLSINHEARGVPVRSLFQTPAAFRFPYWLRRGYIEELFVF